MIYGTAKGGIARRSDTGTELLVHEHRDLGAALLAGADRDALDRAPGREPSSAGEAELVAPITAPPNVWAVGLAYRDHRAEARSSEGRKEPDHPPVFLKASSSITGPGAPIELPTLAPDEVDYEGEVAVVIGHGGSNIPASAAWDYVFGLTAANDVSARDVQFGRYFGGNQDVTKAKSFDTFTPLGPWIVTPDEFPDRDAISLATYVNGERRQAASTSQLLWSISEMVAFVSCFATLSPGDLILTGTPAGVGHRRGLFLREGDEVRVEVDRVGALTNRVTLAGPQMATPTHGAPPAPRESTA